MLLNIWRHSTCVTGACLAGLQNDDACCMSQSAVGGRMITASDLMSPVDLYNKGNTENNVLVKA